MTAKRKSKIKLLLISEHYFKGSSNYWSNVVIDFNQTIITGSVFRRDSQPCCLHIDSISDSVTIRELMEIQDWLGVNTKVMAILNKNI